MNTTNVGPKVIIFDVYGTILKSDAPDYTVRDGFRELISYYSKAIIVAFSDASEDVVGSDLVVAEIINKFDVFYSERNCIQKHVLMLDNKDRLQKLGLDSENQEIKDLEQVARDFDVSLNDLVFIGDNKTNKDKESAIYHGVNFIQVPQYREKMPNERAIIINGPDVFYKPVDFSFKSLIGKL